MKPKRPRLKQLPMLGQPLGEKVQAVRARGSVLGLASKRFYASALWQRTRAAKLGRDPLCQYCAARDVVTAADQVDHRHSIVTGGHRTADANLVSACVSCHSVKTRAENAGEPLPPYAPSADRGLGMA